jgi:hypothetical protein
VIFGRSPVSLTLAFSVNPEFLNNGGHPNRSEQLLGINKIGIDVTCHGRTRDGDRRSSDGVVELIA